MTGINFRATSGYVSDPIGTTYANLDLYPTTRAGTTFGYKAGVTPQTRDRSVSVDARIAGSWQHSNALGTKVTFLYDVGAGSYELRLAVGDASFGTVNSIVVTDGDGGDVLGTITGSAAPSTPWPISHS